MDRKKQIGLIGHVHHGRTVFAQTTAQSVLSDAPMGIFTVDPEIMQGIPPVEPTESFQITNHRIDPLPQIAMDGKSNRRNKRKQKRKKNGRN